MNILFQLLKSKLAAAGAVLVVAVIIVFMGPRFYLVRPWNFIVAGLVILGWLGWLVYKKLQAKKNASALEGFLRQQADDQLLTARPDVKDEIAALKEKLERAIKTLKQSKLGKGRRGIEALYVLPWYMIIGPSACGKSTAIRNSGLNFPPIDPDSDSPGAIKGLGGTRNCDWWFTNEGILLDTAGRYTIAVDSAEDREEWSAFLGLLKKYRRKNPINGLLVMVSIDELVQQSEDGLEAHAKNIRQRIDELMVKLELIFPIYLVFTKCDLLAGFVEFFGDISKREREQVWGYTCKYDPERTTPVQEEFRRESEKLYAALTGRRLRKLAGDLRPGDEKQVFLFPLEFDAARRKLISFVQTLFQTNPFQQNPALRGMYFTSGTQEGTPIGQVMASMAREFSIQEDLAALLEPPKEPKAYFIKDLFMQIIMSDQAATRPTASSAKRNKWTRLALAGGVGLATVLLVLAMATSYFGNRSLMAQTEQSARTLLQMRAEGATTFISDLEVMNRVRLRLEELDRYNEDGPPLHLRWGLYKGETVNRAARVALLKRITDRLMIPTTRKFEQYLRETMQSQVAGEERFSDVGTAYMMLTEPPETAPKDLGALTEQTNHIWTSGPDTSADWRDDFQRSAEPLVRYWWHHRAEPGMAAILLPKDRELSGQVSRYIAEHWSFDQYYRKLIRDASGNLRDFTVEGAVPGTVLLSGSPLRGAYTKAGWESAVQTAIEKSRDEVEQDPFLKKNLADSKKDIERELFALYVANYKKAWAEFLGGVQVSSFATIGEAVEGLGELGKKESPIITLLTKATENASIEWKGNKVEDITNEFSGINEFLGRTGAVGAVTGPSDNVKSYLEFLANAAKKLEDGQGALEAFENCAKSFKELARGVDKEKEKAERLLVAGGSPLCRKASELLAKPFVAARGTGYASACNCLNEAWKAKVVKPFEEKLGGNYPFNAHGPDAPLAAVVEFFGGSSGGIGAFEASEGQPAEQAGMAFSGAYQEALAAAQKIRTIVPGNALNVSFTLVARATQFKNAQEATFTLGGKSYSYKMGGERRYDIAWGAAGGGECSVSIIPLSGQQAPPLREAGDWGLFRILDRAQIRGNAVSWTLGGSTGGYELAGPAANFIQTGHFAAFKCPAKVCGE